MALKKALYILLAHAIFFSSAVYAMSEKIAPAQNTFSERTQYTDFYLADLDGIYTRLSDHKGKVIFLNFFATWCPPCRNELPSMQKLHEKMKTSDFEMIAVSVDRAGKERVREFIGRGGYSFKVLLDSDGSTAKKYHVSSIPATFIIDKSGKIVNRVIGERDWASDAIISELKKLAQ